MRKALGVLALTLTLAINAQHLEQKIPANAEAVISINGKKMLELLPANELNNYMPAREILKDFNRNRDEANAIKSVTKIGFDLNESYYYYTTNDSISYHVFLVNLNNREQYESLLSKYDLKKTTTTNGVSTKTGWSELTVWNDNTLALVSYDIKRTYIDDNAKRLNPDDDFYDVKKDLGKLWTKKYAMTALQNKTNTIRSNTSYTQSKDNNAASTVWVKNYGNLIQNSMESLRYFMPRDVRKVMMQGNSSDIYGITTFTTKLYFDTDAIRVATKMKIADSWKDTYKKMYKSKLDKRFFNYFDQNKALAYISMSVNSEEMLKAYPHILQSMYGGLAPAYNEEVSLGAELISLFLDEEAIGELITGDMLFVFNDLSKKEVTYTSYEYDEDYNSKEVTKTKNELSPDFTILIGSENKAIINKFLHLGVKYHKINKTANYYQFKTPKSVPFNTYAVMKDGMLILTTSATQIANIASGRFKANVGKHKKLMRKNSTVFYVNNEALINKIPTDDFRARDLASFNAFKNAVTGQSLMTSKLAGDSFITTATIDTKAANGNALKYIFDTIEAVYNASTSSRNEHASATRIAVPVASSEVEEIVYETEEKEPTQVVYAEDVEVEEDEIVPAQPIDAAKDSPKSKKKKKASK